MKWFGLFTPTPERDINFFLCWVRHWRPQWFDSVAIDAITVTFQRGGKTCTVFFDDLAGREYTEEFLRQAGKKLDSALEYLEDP